MKLMEKSGNAKCWTDAMIDLLLLIVAMILAITTDKDTETDKEKHPDGDNKWRLTET